MRNLIQWMRRDENVHRAFVVLGIHEIFDFGMYQLVSYMSLWWFAVIAWSISFVTGIFMGHWAIEKHDKHDHGDTHETWEDVDRRSYAKPYEFQIVKLEGCKE